jgi:hypothetical protein
LPLLKVCSIIRRADKTVLLAQAIVALACPQIQEKHKREMRVTAVFYFDALAAPLDL